MMRLQHKVPLLIAGASGSSWGNIAEGDQAEIERGLSLLVQQLDPEKVYFAMGRVKHEGIGRVLDNALDAFIQRTPDAPCFDVVGMLSQDQNMPALADHINHIVPLSGELMSVPTQMTNQLHAHQGCALYIGGNAFTRDFILCSARLGIPFGVMAGIAGASGDKAHILPRRHVFEGAEGMVQHVRDMMGSGVFRAA